ncbi:hypothetical protein Hdeb2414_s0018g00519841 [Helianthus debilis subsp. tardiflorus]
MAPNCELKPLAGLFPPIRQHFSLSPPKQHFPLSPPNPTCHAQHFPLPPPNPTCHATSRKNVALHATSSLLFHQILSLLKQCVVQIASFLCGLCSMEAQGLNN